MENAVKIGAVIGYLLILLGIGVVASRRMKDVRDYFAAGKNLGYLTVAFSARATGESAWLLLGLTGMGAIIGVKAFWVVLGEIFGVVGAWVLMSRRFKRLTDRYDSVTVPDFLESRFRDEEGQSIRKVATFALTIFVTIYVSAQIDATGKAFESEQFLGWGYYPGIAVGFGVVAMYIFAGGFLAVAWSDVFQGTLMVIGLVVLPLVGVISAGGWSEVSAGLMAINPDLLTWHGGIDSAGGYGWTGLNILGIVGLSLIGLGFLGSPQIFVRFIALRDETEIKVGTLVAFVWTILADSGAVLVGMIGRHLLTGPGDDVGILGSGGENILPMLVDHVMPLVLVGLYIAIVLSAIMSTIDSLLVVAGSALVRDYYQKVRNPDIADKDLMSMSRNATLGLALIALVITLLVAWTTEERTVFWFVIFGWSGIAATFCPVTILSLYWGGMTRRGAIASMVSGFVAVPFFKFVAPQMGSAGPYFVALTELPPAFAVSLLAGVVVSMLDKEKLPDDLLRADLEKISEP